MNKAQEIIEILGSERVNIENALIKAQILASDVGNDELAQWVKNELLGYPDRAVLPEYRILVQTVEGDVSNGVYRHRSVGLPMQHLNDGGRNSLRRRYVREGIAEVQTWVGNPDLVLPLPPELSAIAFKPAMDPSYHVERAWGKLSVGAVEGLLAQIRSRLLDFALEVARLMPADEVLSAPRAAAISTQVGDLLKGAIFGDHATIQIGSGNVATISNNVVTNDIESLVVAMRKNGIDEPDLESLREAVSSDANSDAVPGVSVKGWMGRMLSKAASGTWQVGVGAAGNLLASALGSFYGVEIK